MVARLVRDQEVAGSNPVSPIARYACFGCGAWLVWNGLGWPVLNGFLNGMRGVAIGAANIMPGVSGATLALVFGIYEELVASVNSVFAFPKKSMSFLAPVGAGMAIGILAFGWLVDSALAAFPIESRLLIAGLILGSLPGVFRVANKGRAKGPGALLFVSAVSAALAVAPLLLAPGGAGFSGGEGRGPGFLAYVFVAGLLAAAALMVPGISGAMVFILFGLYPVVTGVIAQVWDYIRSPLDFGLLGQILAVAAPMGAGILLGILLCARLIEALLRKFHAATYYAIMGLIFGSVWALFLTEAGAVSEAWAEAGAALALAGPLCFFAGFALSLFLGGRGRKPD